MRLYRSLPSGISHWFLFPRKSPDKFLSWLHRGTRGMIQLNQKKTGTDEEPVSDVAKGRNVAPSISNLINSHQKHHIVYRRYLVQLKE